MLMKKGVVLRLFFFGVMFVCGRVLEGWVVNGYWVFWSPWTKLGRWGVVGGRDWIYPKWFVFEWYNLSRLSPTSQIWSMGLYVCGIRGSRLGLGNGIEDDCGGYMSQNGWTRDVNLRLRSKLCSYCAWLCAEVVEYVVVMWDGKREGGGGCWGGRGFRWRVRWLTNQDLQRDQHQMVQRNLG